MEYLDNKPCIDLISKKPNGILHLLDDESNLPKTTDLSFLEKCNFVHSATNALYKKPRTCEGIFIIRHYAGEVIYEVQNFLDKNRDLLRTDVIDMFIDSRNPLLSKMFRDLRENCESQRSCFKTGRFVTMRPRTPTVAAKFSESLTSLIEEMSKCKPWFVRCIKPNNCKKAMTYEMGVVLEQLCYSGMLETIRIRKIGYPIRYKFVHFTRKFRTLINGIGIGVGSDRQQDEREAVSLFFTELGPAADNMYQMGATKVVPQSPLTISIRRRPPLTCSACFVIYRYSCARCCTTI